MTARRGHGGFERKAAGLPGEQRTGRSEQRFGSLRSHPAAPFQRAPGVVCEGEIKSKNARDVPRENLIEFYAKGGIVLVDLQKSGLAVGVLQALSQYGFITQGVDLQIAAHTDERQTDENLARGKQSRKQRVRSRAQRAVQRRHRHPRTAVTTGINPQVAAVY